MDSLLVGSTLLNDVNDLEKVSGFKSLPIYDYCLCEDLIMY